MKKSAMFLFLLCFANASGQLKYESNQKHSCTVLADDQIECFRSPVTTIFAIDILQNRILQQEDSQRTSFMIDSKTIPNPETIIYNAHTATGEKFAITITGQSIKIQSFTYKDRYTEFDL